MKKSIDWREFGQFLSIVINIFTIIRDTFRQMNIGMEIIPWLIDDGKRFFVDKFLIPLGNEFLTMHQGTHIIDCDADPILRRGCSLKKHTKGGKLEWKFGIAKICASALNGKHLLSEFIEAFEREFGLELALNIEVLDYLFDHQFLIPEAWKINWVKILFLGTLCIDSDGKEYVRCLEYWESENSWYKMNVYLENTVSGHNIRGAFLNDKTPTF